MLTANCPINGYCLRCRSVIECLVYIWWSVLYVCASVCIQMFKHIVIFLRLRNLMCVKTLLSYDSWVVLSVLIIRCRSWTDFLCFQVFDTHNIFEIGLWLLRSYIFAVFILMCLADALYGYCALVLEFFIIDVPCWCTIWFWNWSLTVVIVCICGLSLMCLADALYCLLRSYVLVVFITDVP